MSKQQRIVCAASKFQIPYIADKIILGLRHGDEFIYNGIEAILDNLQIPKKDRDELIPIQGFVDNFGNFLTRGEAFIVAKNANQFLSVMPEGSIRSFNKCKLESEMIY